MDEMKQELTALNCVEVFPLIVLRRASEDGINIPRSPKLLIHLVYGSESAGIKLDRYCKRKNSWTNVETVKTIDMTFRPSSVIYRRGKLIFIGGVNGQHQPLDIVNITKLFYKIKMNLISPILN